MADGGHRRISLLQVGGTRTGVGIVDVALIGTVGYALILLVAVAGLFPALRNDRRITVLLAVLIVTGFIFTLRLKYYEFVVMKLFCRWCAVSAATITLQTVLVWLDWRRVKRDGTS